MSARVALSMSSSVLALSMAKLENNQIDEQMGAALGKAEQAMDAATTGMVMGMVSGLVAAGAGGAAGAAVAQGEHAEPKSGPLGGLAHMIPPGGLHAGAASEIHQDTASKNADQADAQSAEAKGHKSRMRDAITDLLQKLAQINGSIRILG